VREPLVQTQVLPYLRELLKGDYSTAEPQRRRESKLQVSLLTFEPDTSLDAVLIKKQLADEGISWYWLPYHKRFSAIATAWDIFRGTLFIRGFIARERPDILHGRVHVPTLMGALARRLSRHKPKLLFDIRGFFPEEYTDAGIWTEGGSLYRAAKRVERWLLKESDGFVVLTEKARNILFPEIGERASEVSSNSPAVTAGGNDKYGRPVEVVPCCVDLDGRFSGDRGSMRSAGRLRLGVRDRFVITHAGALGGLYLTEKIADLLVAARARDPQTFALFLTQSDPQHIVPLLRERGFEDRDFFVGRVSPADIEEYLCASDVGLSFVKASFATLSRSPTKIAEYLACGLPIIANAGVGDVDVLINRAKVGVLVEMFTEHAYKEAIDKIDHLRSSGRLEERCRETARKDFDLRGIGGKRYNKLYLDLVKRSE
jgi:glycosyltransferase involved in cell wall biosynthesis